MESDEEELIHSAMQHVAQYQPPSSPSPNDAIRTMLRNLVPSAATPVRHSPIPQASSPLRGVGGSGVMLPPDADPSMSLVVATLTLTPAQVGQLVQFCTLQQFPMPQISQLPPQAAMMSAPPRAMAPPVMGTHTFTVTAGESDTPTMGRRASSGNMQQPRSPFTLARNTPVVVGGRPGLDLASPNPASVVYSPAMMSEPTPQPGDDAFHLPDFFGEFVRISPQGHDPIRNPGKGVPLARMVLLKIPHGWGPPHMMDMLQKLDVKCYFARKHIKMGPRGEVSKGSGKVLIHEHEEQKLMDMSGAVWCVPDGFYSVRNRDAAANFLETNKHRWGKHLPYELLKVEREEREQCEKGRVAMSNNPQSSNNMLLKQMMGAGSGSNSPMGLPPHTPLMNGNNMLSGMPFRVSSSHLDEISLSPSASSGNFHRPARCSTNGFVQSGSTMSLTSNTSSFECLPHA